MTTARVSGSVARRGVVLWVVAVAVAAGLGALFGWWAFAPPPVRTEAQSPATVAVTEMTVGRSLPLAVSATWHPEPFGVGAAAGTLTSLDIADGDVVDAGDVLYTVDLRPVVAAVGAVPAFRDLGAGTVGEDVRQIQQLLHDTGFLVADPTGRFGPATTAAVRAWQRSLGVTVDGVVRAGDVVFTSTLPARVLVNEGVTVGARLTEGDVVLSLLSSDPEFVATAPATVAVDADAPVTVTFDGEPVPVVVTGQRNDQSGNTLFVLARADGSPVCADRCDLVPLDRGAASFPARQVVVPEVTGPGVPAAALWLDPLGSPYLVTEDGTEIPVTIRGRGDGRVVLDGVETGTVVRLPDATAAEPS
ncbi:Peptidoglycan-binding domain 1 protein [Xylanimonas cellulosilytica DSM 15894]|uniref:Peptidoglycan-binding domain 1 protein n=1 Tax=Xylanimonas cellulosilytica (strain DSM 15894 / JCM 12276 / CECT 5975 / KCTC 9989 / LMG 20990 / NBRC 107835 / XIL07) TaxID=446471 RepID=D1BSB9_XYLCX|nr:peptidoglycan-binding domain-containing protein [Xylanimonas cellulosilytica]ACZ30611.1 Peptidoglycan-binding domain 1 protein [Xylanimonas cellulosilytica DSM 15894]